MHVHVIFRWIGMCFDRVNAITAYNERLLREQYRWRSDKRKKSTVIRCTNSSVNVRAGQKPIAIVSQLFVHFVARFWTKTNGRKCMLWHIGFVRLHPAHIQFPFYQLFCLRAHLFTVFNVHRSAIRKKTDCAANYGMNRWFRINWRKRKTKRWLPFCFFFTSIFNKYRMWSQSEWARSEYTIQLDKYSAGDFLRIETFISFVSIFL